MTNNLDHDELEILWIGALSYYLGRCSPLVADFCEMLVEQWSSFPETLQYRLALIILTRFKEDDIRRAEASAAGDSYRAFPLGERCDRLSWERVRDLIMKRALKEMSGGTYGHV